MSNRLDTDQSGSFVWPSLGPNCLQRFNISKTTSDFTHLQKIPYTNLTDFNYATLTSLYSFQKTVEYKLHLLRLCQHELASSAKALVLTVQPNLMMLLLRINLGH